MTAYPPARDPSAVGSYPALAKAGGGYVWDEVLEYRVWCHRPAGDSFRAFATYEEALTFSTATAGAERPLALVLQREYIDENEPGEFIHRLDERITEWSVEHLSRPRRTATTIPAFFAPDAPANRLDIVRGRAK